MLAFVIIIDFNIDSHFLAVYKANFTHHINNTWSIHFILSVSAIPLTHHYQFVYRLISSVKCC